MKCFNKLCNCKTGMNDCERYFEPVCVRRISVPESEQAASAPVDSLSAGSVVYTVQFNDVIYESSFYTVSIHRTKAGAVRAMRKLKTEMFMGEFWDMEQEWSAFRYGKLCIQE